MPYHPLLCSMPNTSLRVLGVFAASRLRIGRIPRVPVAGSVTYTSSPGQPPSGCFQFRPYEKLKDLQRFFASKAAFNRPGPPIRPGSIFKYPEIQMNAKPPVLATPTSRTSLCKHVTTLHGKIRHISKVRSRSTCTALASCEAVRKAI
jgi:hypothetical protein